MGRDRTTIRPIWGNRRIAAPEVTECLGRSAGTKSGLEVTETSRFNTSTLKDPLQESVLGARWTWCMTIGNL